MQAYVVALGYGFSSLPWKELKSQFNLPIAPDGMSSGNDRPKSSRSSANLRCLLAQFFCFIQQCEGDSHSYCQFPDSGDLVSQTGE